MLGYSNPFYYLIFMVQSAGATKYTDCIYAEG